MPIRTKQKIIVLTLLFSLSLLGKWSLNDVRDWFSINLPENIFKEVNKAIIGTLQAKNIRFILPNNIEMDDIEVLDEENKPVLAAKHAKVVVSIASLLTNNIIIKDAVVLEPYFRYTIIKDVHNIIEVFSPKNNQQSSGEKIRVTIEKVRAVHGTFEMYHDVGLDIFAQEINAEGSFWVEPGPFSVDIKEARIARGGIFVAGMDLPITNLVTEHLKISDESVSTAQLTAFYEQSFLQAHGEVDIKHDAYHINANLNAPKGTWPAGLQKMPFSIPSFRAEVAITGNLIDPQIWTTVNHDDFELQNIPIKRGEINALVNADRLYVDPSEIHLAKQGSLVVQGHYNFHENRYAFDTKLSNALLEHLANFINVTQNTSGSVYADIGLSGLHTPTIDQVAINAKGKIKDGSFDQIHLKPSTNFEGNFSWHVNQELSIEKLIFTDEAGSRLSTKGSFSLQPKVFGTLNTDLYLRSFKDYFRKHDIPIDAKEAHLKGTLHLLGEKPEFQGHLSADIIKLDKVTIEDPQASIDLGFEVLQIEVLTAHAYGGNVTAHVAIANLYDKQIIEGEIRGEGLDITRLPIPIDERSGRITTNIALSGTLKNPEFAFSLTAPSFQIYNLGLNKAIIEGSYKNNLLLLSKLDITAHSALISGNNISLNLADQSLHGMVSVVNLSWHWLLAGVSDQILGEMEGSISLDGTLKNPLIEGLFEGHSIELFGVPLGKGLIGVSFNRKNLKNSFHKDALVASLSANLSAQDQKTILRASYAIATKTINLKSKFSSMLVDTDKTLLKNKHTRFHGLIDADITARGHLDNPAISLNLSSPRYVLNRDFHEKNPFPEQSNYMGPLTLRASLINRQLKSEVCMMINDSLDGQCNAQGGIKLSADGSFRKDSFKLGILAQFDVKDLEKAITDLREEYIGLNISGQFSGSLVKTPSTLPALNGNLSLKEMEINLPNIKKITLKEPSVIELTGNDIDLGPRLLFDFAEGTLSLKGAIKNNQMDITAQGNIPLMASRFFVPLVQRAKGVLSGEIRATGKVNEPILQGKITLEKGCGLTFKKWFDPVEFNHGVIIFTKVGSHSFLTNLSSIDAKVGEGHLFVDGSFLKTYRLTTMDKRVKNFHLKAIGNGLTFRDKNTFIETDLNIFTEQEKNKLPLLRGQVILADGHYYQQFDLRNFIAKASHSLSDLRFIDQSQVPLGLDIELLVRQFGVSARMVNVDISSTFSGQLKTVGTLANPKMIGSLTLNEGVVNFPFNQFDLFETSIPMNENSNRFFDPEINIQSTKELTKEEYPILSQDTVVQLSLIGDRDNLRLGLTPINGDLKLSPFKIFLLLLSPGIAQSDEFDQMDSLKSGAKNAFLAFSGEIFLRPLANEFADMLQGNTQTKVKLGSTLEPGSVRLNLTWTLSPRIELIGSYSFLSDNRLGLEYEQKSNFNYTRSLLGEIKSKITLFDHPPIGPLFLETSFGANRLGDEYEPRGSILFRYRVYEK